jgi:hypothetical protein
MEVSTPNEQLLFSTVFVKSKTASNDQTATGFIYAVPVKLASGETGDVHFLVTNRHVLKDATEVSFQMVRADSAHAMPVLGQPWGAALNISDDAWTGHSDPKVDVAVMAFGYKLNMVAQQTGHQPFFRAVPSAMSMNDQSSKDLDAIEEIIFIGYPRGIFDTVNLTPVARRGITATPLSLEYEGVPAFLVDGAVFPGSSGSPVFLAQTGSYNARSGGLVIGNRLMFLGVIAAVHTSPALGKLIDLPVADKGSVTMLPMNLGIVYKASAIDATIDAWLDANNISRLAPEQQSDSSEVSGAVDREAARQTEERVESGAAPQP